MDGTQEPNATARRGPGRQRSPAQRDLQVRRAVALTEAGATQREVAETLGVSLSTVNHDLRLERRRAAEASLGDLTQALGDELERLDRIEDAAWEAWQKGRTAPVPSVKPLDIALKAARARARLLGLEAPSKHLVGAAVRDEVAEDPRARLAKYVDVVPGLAAVLGLEGDREGRAGTDAVPSPADRRLP